ncbi:MAG: GNAT family N-acetyltransferase [Leptolyngbyaceae cyanobacterium RM2_2_4]|nr:GNAT family N-acetyltransferase [Leptolyngbyaceae cyanobacterium RM2_2_4]
MHIEPYSFAYLDSIIQLSLRAWSPVFLSIKETLSDELYQTFYPDRWEISQQKAVEAACNAKEMTVWVGKERDLVVGFIAVKLHQEDKLGEIHMVAVDPDFQGRGVGSSLIHFALGWMKDEGMSIAIVETGADHGHTPARHTYEKAGFEPFPLVRYFKHL